MATRLTRRGFCAAGAAGLALLGRVGRAAGPQPELSGPLDGRSYAGRLVALGSDRVVEDALHFAAGHFWSAGCVKCSFHPGGYWVRQDAGGTAFRGRLESVDRGVFTYEGRVDGAGGLVADVRWRRERWYWTIEQEFRFEGAEAGAPGPGDLEDAFARALGERAAFCTL
jgi:hypothetical protein